MRALSAATLPLACAGALACSPGATGAAPTPASSSPAAVSLAITVSDRPGKVRYARLSCSRGRVQATGFLRRRPGSACATARRLAGFLAARPPDDRICTQIYGGPATARVGGRIAGRAIDRRFARTNGCEIADWRRAGLLLAPPPAPPASP